MKRFIQASIANLLVAAIAFQPLTSAWAEENHKTSGGTWWYFDAESFSNEERFNNLDIIADAIPLFEAECMQENRILDRTITTPKLLKEPDGGALDCATAAVELKEELERIHQDLVEVEKEEAQELAAEANCPDCGSMTLEERQARISKAEEEIARIEWALERGRAPAC